MSGSALRKDGSPRRISLLQGETRISDDPDAVITTILGSCISACLFDPDARIGGMNHFLLAEPGSDTDPNSMHRYGVYAMEVLINAMLAMGVARSRLKARIYGGAAMRDGFRDIGGDNAIFARRFLRDERIALVGEDVGGTAARRVDFRAAHGQARSRLVVDAVPKLKAVARRPAAPPSSGDVEFF